MQGRAITAPPRRGLSPWESFGRRSSRATAFAWARLRRVSPTRKLWQPCDPRCVTSSLHRFHSSASASPKRLHTPCSLYLRMTSLLAAAWNWTAVCGFEASRFVLTRAHRRYGGSWEGGARRTGGGDTLG